MTPNSTMPHFGMRCGTNDNDNNMRHWEKCQCHGASMMHNKAWKFMVQVTAMAQAKKIGCSAKAQWQKLLQTKVKWSMKQIFNTVGTQEQELCITRCLESSGEFNSWIIPLSAFNNCQCLKQWILCNGWRKIGTILSCKSLEKNILPPLPPSCYKLLGTLLLKIARGLSDLAMPQDALNNIMASSFTSLCNIKTFLSHTLSMAFMSCIGLINNPSW